MQKLINFLLTFCFLFIPLTSIAQLFDKNVDQAINDYLNGHMTPEQKSLLNEQNINPEDFRGTDNAGGPDTYGYLWFDSEEDDLVYNWQEIEGSGEYVYDLEDENNAGPFDIGFDFPFYGIYQSEFYINSNGVINFSDENISLVNLPIPYTYDYGLIAIFWEDMQPGEDMGHAYYENITHEGMNALAIHFIDYSQYPASNNGEINMQAILREDGAIIFQYHSFTAALNVSSCTIGIQGDIEHGSGVIHNGSIVDYPYEELAIKFYVPESNAYLTGTVTDSQTGLPLQGVMVNCESGSSITNDDGVYHIHTATTGTNLITATHPDYLFYEENLYISPGDNEYDISLQQDSSPDYGDYPYFWLDIENSGTLVADGDDFSEAVFISDYGLNPILYYGIEYDMINVCSNGFVSFTSNSTSYFPHAMPGVNEPNATLGLFYSDLHSGINDSEILVGNVENKFVISYLNIGNTENEVTINAQIVIDTYSSQIFFNYQSIEVLNGEYDDLISIGFENETGELGHTFNYGFGTGFPENETSYYIGQEPGLLTGTVTHLETSEGIEGAEIFVYDSESLELVDATITVVDGNYSLHLLPGVYYVELFAVGFNTQFEENVLIGSGETTVVDFVVGDDIPDPVIVSGNIISTEWPPLIFLSSVHITMYDLEGNLLGSTVSGDDGAYALDEVLVEPGVYNFYLTHDPVGSHGYHDVWFEEVVVDENGLIDFGLHPIMPPENVIVFGDMFSAHVTWDLPANEQPISAADLEFIRSRSSTHINNSEKQLYYNQMLKFYETLNPAQSHFQELDALGGIEGYIIKDETEEFIGETNNDVFEYTVTGLEFCHDYFYAVAADYGYGDGNLIFSEQVEVYPEEGKYIFDDGIPQDWFDVRNHPDAQALGLSDEDGVVVELGDEFVFFGELYSSILVGSNGGITFDLDMFPGYTPTALPNPDGPYLLVAPFWEDLNPDLGDEFDAFYVNTGQIFWVEWYAPYYNSDEVVNFELGLNFESGDIIFNYNMADTWSPAAVVGVQNADGTVAYTWHNNNVEDQTTVLVDYRFDFPAQFEGYVFDHNGEPLEGVEIFCDGELVAVTDTAGYFFAFINSGEHTITYVYPDYIDIEEIIVAESCELFTMPDIHMSAPLGQISPTALEFYIVLVPDYTGSAILELENIGTGVLDWECELEITSIPDHWHSVPSASNGPNSEHTLEPIFSKRSDKADKLNSGPTNTSYQNTDDVWEHLLGFDTPETVGGVGAVVTDQFVYTCEWGFDANYQFFKYDFAGNMINSQEFPDELRGVRDLAWDGTWMYAGNQNHNGRIYRFNPDDVTDFDSLAYAYDLGRGIAIDHETGDIYTSNWTDLGKLEFDGNNYNLIPMDYPLGTIGCYGLAWMPQDPDGKNLWMFCQPDENGVIYRVDPVTLEVDDGYEVYRNDQGFAGGIDIYNGYQSHKWNIATNLQADPDRVDLWEGYDVYDQWLFVEPDQGSVEMGESDNITISYDLVDHEILEVAEFMDEVEAEIVFSGPLWEGITVPILITIGDGFENSVELLPEKYALHQNYPNPFNPATRIDFDLVETQNVKLTIFNVLGQEVARLVNRKMEAGYHTVEFNASNLTSGIYFYRLETGDFTNIKKMVLVR